MLQSEALIIGAGPCGLFQAFELGLLGIRADIIDALPHAGGQCMQLYPNKPLYDIPGFTEISGSGLTQRLMQQIRPFKPRFWLDERVLSINETEGGRLAVVTDAGREFDAAAIIIATGGGAFSPVKLKVEGAESFEGKQLFYSVADPAVHHNKQLVVLGGGDSALDWALNLQPHAESLVLIHRSANFRAQPNSIRKMQKLCDEMQMQFLAGQVVGLDTEEGQLKGIRVQSADAVIRRLETDHLLVFFGMTPDLASLKAWQLELEGSQIRVDTARFETSKPGVYAVGDICWYPGKRKLILSGFHEAALAAYAIKARTNPDQPLYTQYTTTSPIVHQRLGVKPEPDLY
ncbi:NAD(P)/FAD-dependent oxidoreductase [Marinobacterium jannaschii]|uniref:NAD(P)/FAD-dependent oxidoreductase n=1 Tax=Marinobacterium jannaschii TaxID=64970 RepID=UPI000685CDA1|nr:NAD(P)/FAD-dependent oxidoreductase [Marinobacterium jannaschii]